MRPTLSTRRSSGAALALATALLVACSTPGTGQGSDPAGGSRATSERPDEPAATPDPDRALSWGPTVGELESARAMVAEWSAERLAGQVIIGRYHGTDPGEVGRLVSDLHLAGVSVTSGNVVDAGQVRATTKAVSDAVAADGRDFPAIIGVDQEGGYVAHLRDVATEFPTFSHAGAAIESRGRAGRAVVRDAAYATAMELRDLGFTWVFAPVADVTIGAADPTIGTRSPSPDPQLAARATGAAVRGYDEAGMVSTTKHFPGHGAVTSDSHDTLPVLDAGLRQLRKRELVPFEAAVANGAPAIMLSHLAVPAIAPGEPASLADEMYDFLRDDLGFDGVTLTDSLGMGAVGGQGQPAVRALAAGADLLLMPVDTRVTHGIVTDALTSGDLSRARVEDAAATVVALQLWQQRVAGDTPVPGNAAGQAERAARALADAGG